MLIEHIPDKIHGAIRIDIGQEERATAHFTESNVLVSFNSVADKSHTPTLKFIEIAWIIIK